MIFMNEYEIDEAARRFYNHPVLGPATQTLANLRDVVNQNSDGWGYWKLPTKAAAKLQKLIMGDGAWEYRFGERDDATLKELKAALTPIKSFRTKTGLSFEIVERNLLTAIMESE